ncbi:heavy-metal-associated domain-containing protein [Candidatus Pacearchaeota archaeon]|nr:heavy-metal-associated domain-containing protein [Candidatus Pacearchaeota archaeon]
MNNKKIFEIKGMHCDSCAKIIELELKDKVNNIKVDIKKGNAEMEFDESKISESKIKEIINGLGYKI